MRAVVVPGGVIRWLGPWRLDRVTAAWRRRFVADWQRGEGEVVMERHHWLTVDQCPHLFAQSPTTGNVVLRSVTQRGLAAETDT